MASQGNNSSHSPSNSALIEKFGSASLLCLSSGQLVPAPEVLANKTVLLYFSASWCSPCTRFTPSLIDMYNRLKRAKSEASSEDDFEIVFCSFDKTPSQHQKYASKMPWFSVPLEQDRLCQSLAQAYKMEGIPHLVVIGKDSEIITLDGVGEVSLDPTGQNFPWRPKKFDDLLPSEYLLDSKTKTPSSSLSSKYVMLYFSASWCPPCQQFTPKLCKAYEVLKKHRNDFEILFVSADETQHEFEKYFAHMPFAAIPFEEEDCRRLMTRKYEIQGYPTLLMLGPSDREVINTNVRAQIEGGNDYISDFPYYPKAYGSLEGASEDINSHKCVVVFFEGGDDEEQEDLMDAMELASSSLPDLKLYWALQETHVSKSVREACRLGPIEAKPSMILLDIPDKGGYYVCETSDSEIASDDIVAFVEKPGARRQIE